MLHAKKQVPALDHTTRADHALERLATFPGRIKHRAIFQGAGVVRGNQGPLDHGLAVAEARVDNLQFIVHDR